MWLVFALLSAVFATLTSILAKVGVENVNSNVATFIRTCVVVAASLVVVFVSKSQNSIFSISRRSLVFLLLSGLATGASWLCYYKALQIGQASKVVPIDKLSTVLTVIIAIIVFGESVNIITILGLLLLTVGTILIAT